MSLSRLAIPALLACLAATPAFAQLSGGPDAFGMSYTQSSLDFVPLAGATGTTSANLGDDGETTVTLPWAFPFYGATYTEATVGSNGGVRFGAAQQIAYNNVCGQTGGVSSQYPDLMVFWDDLYSDPAGQVHSQYDVANDRFIISWENIRHLSTSTDRLSFQVHLESNGSIEMHWLDLTTGSVAYDYGASATIGIVDRSGGTLAGLEVACNVATPALQGVGVLFAPCDDLDEDGFLDAACSSGFGDDCDDSNPAVNPGATEACDGVDNNCAGGVDEGACPGCAQGSSAGHTYQLCFGFSTSWGNAEVGCDSVGYYLVTIDDAAENAYLGGELAALGVNSGWWIGYTDAGPGNEGNWEWTGASAQGSYENWNSGEPNDFNNEDCAEMSAGTGWAWNDLNCGSSNAFICEGDF